MSHGSSDTKQDQDHTDDRTQPPAKLFVRLACLEELESAPHPDAQPHERSEQDKTIALPKHGEDFAGITKILEVQAIGARVVFGDELRGRDLKQQQ